MKSKIGVTALIVGLLAVGGAYWWLESSTRPTEAPSSDATVPIVTASGSTSSALVAGSSISESMSGAAVGELAAEQRIEGRATVGDILAEPDEDFVRVAKKLTAITLDSGAPMEEREEALAHALNLSAGNEAEVLTPLVKDPKLPDELADTILAEALNRSLSYQADLYLAALAVRKSPEMQEKIREHLKFLTDGEDHGPNPVDWAADIKKAKESWPD